MGSGMCKSAPASADMIHQDGPMEDDAQHQNRRAKGYRDGERDAGSQALLQQAHYRAAGTEDGEDRFTDPSEHEQMNAVHSTSMKSPQREVVNAPPPSGSLAANVRKPVIHRRKKKRATVAPAISDPFENFPALSGGENNMYQANQARYYDGQRIQNNKDTMGSGRNSSSSSSNYSRDRVGESDLKGDVHHAQDSAAISKAGADQEEKRHAKMAEG